jgi:hypothetical protein
MKRLALAPWTALYQECGHVGAQTIAPCWLVLFDLCSGCRAAGRTLPTDDGEDDGL